jgi:zinc transport system substrate-binding protein
MEPWAEDILKGTDKGRLVVVDASAGVRFSGRPEQGDDHGHGSGDGREGKGQSLSHEAGAGADPHIWLDFENARRMVGTIADAFISKDPANREIYRKNAEQYQARLEALDRKYRDALSGCGKRIFINGGHFTFGYLADRYGLRYRSAYGFSPDAEPAAKDLADISRTLRQEGLSHIFYEELLTPRIAETIAKETGAGLLRLHGAHNISREELAAGVSFIDLMEKNLEQLSTGLQCR